MITVQIADMKIARNEGTLITYALGSCVGISLYDPVLKLAALIHIMLPEALKPVELQPHKFADTGIRDTLKKMAILGGNKSRYICKIAGGAQMFKTDNNNPMGMIGAKNIDMVKKVLSMERIPIVAQDCGANYARTMSVDVVTGKVNIKTIGRPNLIL